MFTTKYGEPIARVLAAYPNAQRQVQALEILFRTALAQQEVSNEEAIAKKRCRGLHTDKPGRDAACGKCLDAVMRNGGRGESVAPEGVEQPPSVSQELEEDETLVKSLLGGGK